MRNTAVVVLLPSETGADLFGEGGAGESAGSADATLNQMMKSVHAEIQNTKRDIVKKQHDVRRLQLELTHIGRDLTLSEQQMTMLHESADQFEIAAQDAKDQAARQIQTQVRKLPDVMALLSVFVVML